MALINTKKLKGALRGAMENAASAVKDAGAQERIPEIKVSDRITGLIETAKDEARQLSDINMSKKVSGLVNTVKNLAADERQSNGSIGFSAIDALSIFYYLMSADGALLPDEIERFNSIFDDMVTDASLDKDSLCSTCQERIDANASSISPLIPAIACVDTVLLSPSPFMQNEVPVSPRLLIWDLMAIAFSDGICDDTERELINHIAKSIGVDETTVMEMESTVLTISDIENEEKWIKTTDRQYLVIEPIVEELEKRKAAAFEGAQSLTSL